MLIFALVSKPWHHVWFIVKLSQENASPFNFFSFFFGSSLCVQALLSFCLGYSMRFTTPWLLFPTQVILHLATRVLYSVWLHLLSTLPPKLKKFPHCPLNWSLPSLFLWGFFHNISPIHFLYREIFSVMKCFPPSFLSSCLYPCCNNCVKLFLPPFHPLHSYECMLSCVWLLATLWTIAHQAPLSLGFCRQQDCSGLLFASLGDLPDPGIEPASLASLPSAGRFFTTAPPGKPSPLFSCFKIFRFFHKVFYCLFLCAYSFSLHHMLLVYLSVA